MRNRIIRNMYELAQICVPAHVAEFIMSKKETMRDGEARRVYEELKQAQRVSPTYDESQRLQYLTELFWVMGSTRVTVARVGERECVPTCYLEREGSWFGYDKVQPCVVLSLRVTWNKDWRGLLGEMTQIVEGKMRSFKTDFYFHDMMTLSREQMRYPWLWNVAESHTHMEILDAVGDADIWARAMEQDGDRVRRMLSGYDDTWMGAALKVACSDHDGYYYYDGAVLHEVSRSRFAEIHKHHVMRVRELVCETIESMKAA